MNVHCWTVFIAALSFIFSVVSLIITLSIDAKRNRALLFTEYAKRYQDIVLHLYSDPQNKGAYHRLYFDLCSEEYYLHSKNLLPKDIWGKWEYGMKLMLKKEPLRNSWKMNSVYYDQQPEFKKFFGDIIQQSINNQY